MSTKFGPSGSYIASVHASKLLCGIIFVAVAAAVVSLVILATFFPAFIFILPFVLWQGYQSLRRDGLRLSSTAIVALQQQDAFWRLTQKDGKAYFAKENGLIVRTSYLLILSHTLIPSGKIMRLTIPKDAMRNDQFCCLLARLWS